MVILESHALEQFWKNQLMRFLRWLIFFEIICKGISKKCFKKLTVQRS